MARINGVSEMIPDVQVSAINGLEGVDVVQCKEITESLGAVFKQREFDIVG